MSFLKRVNRTPVAPALLGEAMELHASVLAEDDPSFERWIFRLADFLADKGHSGSRQSDLALAIEFRLTALARLARGDHLRGWSLPSSQDGQVFLHADLLKAASKEPLIEGDDGKAVFEPSSFTQRALSVAEARGRA